MKYKLGSMIDLSYDDPTGVKPASFEWNICLMDERGYVSLIGLPIGNRTGLDPIVQKARELVDLLNIEDKERWIG